VNHKEYVSIVFAGEVDHGKSSIIGRLLADRGAIPPSIIEKVRRICETRGIAFEHAFILDAFEEEQKSTNPQMPIEIAHSQNTFSIGATYRY